MGPAAGCTGAAFGVGPQYGPAVGLLGRAWAVSAAAGREETGVYVPLGLGGGVDELGRGRSELGRETEAGDADALQTGDPVGVHGWAGERRCVGGLADRAVDREVGLEFLPDASARPPTQR